MKASKTKRITNHSITITIMQRRMPMNIKEGTKPALIRTTRNIKKTTEVTFIKEEQQMTIVMTKMKKTTTRKRRRRRKKMKTKMTMKTKKAKNLRCNAWNRRNPILGQST